MSQRVWQRVVLRREGGEVGRSSTGDMVAHMLSCVAVCCRVDQVRMFLFCSLWLGWLDRGGTAAPCPALVDVLPDVAATLRLTPREVALFRAFATLAVQQVPPRRASDACCAAVFGGC